MGKEEPEGRATPPRRLQTTQSLTRVTTAKHAQRSRKRPQAEQVLDKGAVPTATRLAINLPSYTHWSIATASF
jgi:hypothetical protein